MRKQYEQDTKTKNSPQNSMMSQHKGGGVTDGLEMVRTVADSPVPGSGFDVALSAAVVRGGWEVGEPLSGVRELSVESKDSGIEGCVGVKLEEVKEG